LVHGNVSGRQPNGGKSPSANLLADIADPRVIVRRCDWRAPRGMQLRRELTAEISAEILVEILVIA
jgi:hypothetical protein